MVRRLFESCLDIVATNICHVESFIGFPDTVGQQIFHAVDKAHKFELENLAEAHCGLSLFSAAYSDQVLSAINIEGQHLMLANCFELVVVFSHIRALDVSSCCLGDQHELLYHISTLQSLEVLLLRNNCLSDEGIQKWTAPIRVKKTGPMNLQILDISVPKTDYDGQQREDLYEIQERRKLKSTTGYENENISALSLKFLRVFRWLQLCNVSSTGINHVKELADFAQSHSLQVQTSLSERQQRDLMGMMAVQTQGWAKEVVCRWIQQAQQSCHQRACPVVSKASRFYGRRKDMLHDSLASVPLRSKRPREQSSVSLVLVSSKLMSGLGGGTDTAAFVSLSKSLTCKDVHIQSQSSHRLEQTSIHSDMCQSTEIPRGLNMTTFCDGVTFSWLELPTTGQSVRSVGQHPSSASSLTIPKLDDEEKIELLCVMPRKEKRHLLPISSKNTCQLQEGSECSSHHGLLAEGGNRKECLARKQNCGSHGESELSDADLLLLSQYT